MEHITRLELEIAELRKTLINKESELAQYKKLLNAEPSACLHQVETFRDGPASVIGEQLPKWAIERYSRQILLPEIGAAGQRRLCAARTLLVGAGGLGCPAAAYLAGAGVGTIGLVDYDTVDQTNLHRQLLHAERSQGVDKVDSAAEALLSINSHIKVNRHSLQLTSENAFEIVSQYDVVVDCTDNVPSAYLLNDATYKAKIPLVSGKALKMEGQLTIYNYRAKGNPNEKDPSYCGPCHRCVFPAPPPPAAVGSCSAGGVCGPVCGAIGALQALETIKLLVGTTHSKLLVGRMLVFDGDDLTFRIVKLRNRNPKCIVCSIDTEQTKLIDYEVFCSMKAVEKPSSTSESETRHRLRRAAERDRRMSGQSYYGFRKTSSEDRRWVQDVQRAERTLGPPCGSSYCARAATRHCQEFDEDTRARIFKHFWSLSWTEKKAYVRSMVRVAEPKRRRRTLAAQTSRKVDSRHYSLQKDGSKMAVCRRMFLNTLGIRDTMARYWLTDKRERRTKVAVKALSVDSYIDALSKSPPKCQICCQMSTRMYLNAGDVKNVFQLYNKYVGDMKCANLQPVSRKTFCKVFSGRELSIFKPKNVGDVCDLVAEHNFAASCQSECLTHDLTDTPTSTSESETRHRLRRAAERDRRMSGQSYYGFRKTSEDRRWVQDVQRAERTLGPACGSSYCARAATRHCQEFDEDTRARIFKHFWSLSWTEKKAYVRSMVRVAEPKRRRRTLTAHTSRKVDSRHYSLQKDESKMAVCRRMFLNTLGIRDTMARYWLTEKRERRTKAPVKPLSVDSYIDALSKSPPKCQICCQMSTRMYLNAGDVKNLFQLYNKYVGDMKCANLQPVSRKTFCKVFSGRELSIFKPKNVGDVCDLVAEHNFAASWQSECLTHDLTDAVCHSLW